MTKKLKSLHLILILASGSLLAVQAQSVPSDAGAVPGVGFQLPRLGGSLSYAVTASEFVSSGFFSGGVNATTTLSGDAAYVSRSERHPFSAVFSGGVLLANSGQPTTTFQNLSFSQVLSTKRWNITVTDSASYLPQSPTTGLSGIPGVGDLGIDPIAVGPTSGIGILTTYGPRVSNTVSGSVGRSLSSRVSAQANGYYSLQRFIGDNSLFGLDSDAEGGSAGMTFHIDARSAVTGNYVYSRFTYPGTSFAFTTQGATVDYSRQWTKLFSTDVYVGPQVITASNPGIYAGLYSGLGSGQVTDGSSVQIAAGASASFLNRRTTYSLTYARGVNNGSGVVAGAFSDNVSLSAHRMMSRIWSASAALGYSRSESLPSLNFYSFTSNAVSASAQVSRMVGRRGSAFASYTVSHQSTSGSATVFNAFSGNYQVFGFGLTYSPGSIPLGK